LTAPARPGTIGATYTCSVAVEAALSQYYEGPDDAEEVDEVEDEADLRFSALVGPFEEAIAPNDVADPDEIVRRKLPGNILAKFEAYSYRSAALILSESHRDEFADILDVLERFTMTTTQIRMPGGNESDIPKAFSAVLRPKGWHETVVRGDLRVRLAWVEPVSRVTRRGKSSTVFEKRSSERLRERYLDGHKVDYVKGRVAFDLEWNSKDQTFDRDLYAFSAFSQCGVIDAAVLVTRSAELNQVFRSLGPALRRDGSVETKRDGTPRSTLSKYGASTTWMKKLLQRLNAGRNGGCPVLALGIKPACISDWSTS
jgi:Restriction endonuclease BglII